MRHVNSRFAGMGGLNLHYQGWLPELEPRAVLALVHGFGEHSGRYAHLGVDMVGRGYAVYAFDLRGHGLSPGQRGYINSWDEFRQDVRAFLATLRREAPGQFTFLMGHSLGGLIALEYALHDPDGLAGVIASAPVLGQVGVSPVRLRLGRILSRVYPTFSLAAGLDLTALSRDPDVVAAYSVDRLTHDRGTARLATELGGTVAWTQAHASDLRVPLLILQGDADRVAAPEGSRYFFDRVTSADKTLCMYPGGYHEPHNDLDKHQVLADLAAWLERHEQLA